MHFLLDTFPMRFASAVFQAIFSRHYSIELVLLCCGIFCSALWK